MKITKNQDILEFMHRCMNNMNDNRMNQFIGLSVKPEDMLKVQRAMKKAGFPEFQKEENQFESLYISTKKFLNTPYHQNIRLDLISSKGFQYQEEIIEPYVLFNSEQILQDPNKELRDWMKLRAMDEPYNAVVLRQNNDVWMLDVPSEANTIDPYAKKAHGHVLTFGLGIGYFIYMASLQPEVKSITVIEHSIEIITMFKKDLLPQFPKHLKLNIIQGDAFDYFNDTTLTKYDYIFVDIHKSNQDGLKIIEQLLQQTNPPFEKVDFWIEGSCFEIMYALIFLFFKSLVHKQKPQLNKDLIPLYRKVEAYFNNYAITVDSVEQLKDLMYSHQTIRAILHHH